MVGHRYGPSRFRFHAPVSMALLGAALLMMSACGSEDPGPGAGTLVIPYVLGNDRSCENLGVATIRVQLDGGFMQTEVDCDGEDVRMRNVPAGLYSVEVFGLDADGVAILDSIQSGPLQQRVTGNSETTEVNPPVILTAAPARLLLRWNFGFGSCSSSGIDHFMVIAWNAADGTEKLMEAMVPCESPGEGAGQYRTVPDEDRDLGGDSFGGVSISVIDDNGDQVGDVVSFEFDAPGRGREVKLSLTCDESGCEGSGKPD